ncbi:MAG: carboxylating nicotinate-nucleotide diphosphorylase [Candidatus Omnitrophica bacterium]|jgi:nicotinate-nucleotide pyrophosphorylase (carboxylating)|nr:carboxylating nicotinate-nucleotide diphosphorylase [Candidatus Omnitrophota bacterium]
MELQDFITIALKEDIGEKDITSEIFLSDRQNCEAAIIAKQPQVICGISVACEVFRNYDPDINFKIMTKDSHTVTKGAVLAKIHGKARNILAAERVALNLLSHLSGIATKTREFVKAIKPYKTRIIDTRKTIPGLRILQKYAVRTGGGYNHRMQMDEMILVKDNHLKIIGGYDKLNLKNSGLRTKGYKIEMEVESLEDFKKALKLWPDIIMLDNMSIPDIKKAVRLRKGDKPKLEASGGITLKNVKEFAATGVDFISIGELTHSVKATDISLEIV